MNAYHKMKSLLLRFSIIVLMCTAGKSSNLANIEGEKVKHTNSTGENVNSQNNTSNINDPASTTGGKNVKLVKYTKVIDFHQHAIIRIGDTFHMNKRNYSLEQLSDFLQLGQCTGLPYTHHVKRKNCMSISIKNMLCGGLCATQTHPLDLERKLKRRQHGSSICTACGPKIVKETFGILCNVTLPKHTQSNTGKRSQLKVVMFKTDIVKQCGCENFECYPGL